MRVAPSIVLTELDQATLERWAGGRATEVRLVQRACMVLVAKTLPEST